MFTSIGLRVPKQTYVITSLTPNLLFIGSWLSLVLLVGVVLIVVCMCLWIAAWAYVMPQDSKPIMKNTNALLCDCIYFLDTCESAWQATRDIIVIVGFVLSFLAVMIAVVAAILAVIAYRQLHVCKYYTLQACILSKFYCELLVYRGQGKVL